MYHEMLSCNLKFLEYFLVLAPSMLSVIISNQESDSIFSILAHTLLRRP